MKYKDHDGWVCAYLLPDASKVLQAPSGDVMPILTNPRDVLGFRHRLVPPTKAESMSPVLIPVRAWSRHIILEEQAVSTA